MGRRVSSWLEANRGDEAGCPQPPDLSSKIVEVVDGLVVHGDHDHALANSWFPRGLVSGLHGVDLYSIAARLELHAQRFGRVQIDGEAMRCRWWCLLIDCNLLLLLDALLLLLLREDPSRQGEAEDDVGHGGGGGQQESRGQANPPGLLWLDVGVRQDARQRVLAGVHARRKVVVVYAQHIRTVAVLDFLALRCSAALNARRRRDAAVALGQHLVQLGDGLPLQLPRVHRRDLAKVVLCLGGRWGRLPKAGIDVPLKVPQRARAGWIDLLERRQRRQGSMGHSFLRRYFSSTKILTLT